MDNKIFEYQKNNSEFFELCKKLSSSSDNERNIIISKIDSWILKYLNNTNNYNELIYIINNYLEINNKFNNNLLRIEKLSIFYSIIELCSEEKNIDSLIKNMLLENIKKYIIPEIKNISSHIVKTLENGEIKLTLYDFNYIYEFMNFSNDIYFNYEKEMKNYISEFSHFCTFTKPNQLINLAIINLNRDDLNNFFNTITNKGIGKLILSIDFESLLKTDESENFVLSYLELIKILMDSKKTIDVVNNGLIKNIIKYGIITEEENIKFANIDKKINEYKILDEFKSQFLYEMYDNSPNENIELLIYYIDTFLYNKFNSENKNSFINDPILKIILSIVRNERYNSKQVREKLIKSLNKYNMLEYINNLPCASKEEINYYIKNRKIKKLISESEKYYDVARIIPYDMAQYLLEFQIMNLCNKKMSINAFKSVIISLSMKLLEESGIDDYCCQFFPSEMMNKSKGTCFRDGFIRYNVKSLDEFLNNGISDYKKNIFNVMYHEIRHAIQYKKINGISKDYDTLLMYKEDSIIRFYDSFYKDNYEKMKVEVDARNYSVQKFLEIMFQISPNIANEYLPFALEYLKKYINSDIAYKKHFKDKQNKVEISVMFDELIKQKPYLLNDNPILPIQYTQDCTRRSNAEIINIIDSFIKNNKDIVEYRNLAYGILNYENMEKSVEEMINELKEFSLIKISDEKLIKIVDIYLKTILDYLKNFARNLVVSGEINKLTEYDIKVICDTKVLLGVIDNKYFQMLNKNFINIIESHFKDIDPGENNNQK